MKLKIEYLAPYLPYGLKLKEQGFIYVLSGVTIGHMLCYENGDLDKEIFDIDLLEESVKPILRPLSDLTKEIEADGEKFVPTENLNTEYPLLIDGGVFFTDSCNLNMLEITEIYEIFQKLLEWHFDVFGLIKAGLAIDINTL
ncbi:hypothetical protein [uncultured Mediterranean phage]|nr:hypothetical protein [uncultured Mediterranean phage]